jgi:hypothetical protein
MDSLTELFAYFDDRITELPFYYPKKAFFQELKDSTTNSFLTHQSQNWLSLRLKDYCETRGYSLDPHGRSQRWVDGKNVTFMLIEKASNT